LAALFSQRREKLIHLGQHAFDVGRFQKGAHFQIFLNREAGENILFLGHEPHAALNQLIGGEVLDGFAVEQNIALIDM